MSDKWKSRLQSSGVPLEFEVAKILVSKKFSVTADYKYSRTDSRESKDFSTDIKATAYTPFQNRPPTSAIELLLECKHRTPNTKWLFWPDPNEENLVSYNVGATLRAVYEFSLYDLERLCTASFDLELPFCYKGVEILIDKGDVFDKEIRHGIAQLQYALPRLFVECIAYMGGAIEDGMPFFFCPILVTNAELFIIHKDINLQDVNNASELTDIGTRTPIFVFYQDYSPDFRTHCSKESSLLAKSSESEKLMLLSEILQTYRRKHFRKHWESITDGLLNAESPILHRYFTQFVVCNIQALPQLIDTIKQVSQHAISKKKRITKEKFGHAYTMTEGEFWDLVDGLKSVAKANQ